MKFFNFNALLFSFFIISCGSGSGGGLDPHLSVEELLELQQAVEINLVGKWRIRRPSGSISAKNSSLTNSCDIDQIEFLNNNTYLLNVSYTVAGESELSYKLYKGVYEIKFTDSDLDAEIERVVLMGKDYVTASAVPDQGSVATIYEITLNEEADDISFSIKLEEDTSAVCLIDSAVSLAGDKEDILEPNAPEDSNHFKIQQEWRMISIVSSIDENETTLDICQWFTDDFYDRCYSQETNSFESNCAQPVALTLIFSGYGTYLFSYFDINNQIISSEEGEWRWVSGTEIPYSSFQVRFEEDSWDDASTIVISELNETVFAVQEIANEQDSSGTDVEVQTTYSFQLSSLPFSNSTCGDLTN
ncbi:MAG: hypothetical protein ACKVHT_09645 [Flavobacteriales bacterium]|jgi:hypothetical protein|tara:strand:+ start:114 stop:1193 length:1080 start_codon:yes stop_codon:yes gene_type:complete